jgi:hypothetical protein
MKNRICLNFFIATLFVLSTLPLGCSSENTQTYASTKGMITTTIPHSTTSITSTTSTLSPVYTWTPIPTLPPADALEKLLGLYSNNGGCSLPCWWGITPGQSTWREAREQLAPLGYHAKPIVHGDITRYEFELVVPAELSSLGYFWPTLTVERNIVTSINLNASYVGREFDYSLAGLLKTFGIPEEIWIRPVVETMKDTSYYDISLFYPSKGVLTSATGNAEKNANSLRICPQEFRLDHFPPSLLLWSSKKEVTYKNIGQRVMGNSSWDTNGYYRLSELTLSFDEKDFYYTYVDPLSNKCFLLDITKLR